MRAGFNPRAAAITCASSGAPASGCKTLGNADCMRLPWPAARITTLIAIVELSHDESQPCDSHRDVCCQRFALPGGQMQADLGAAIQNIFICTRPFVLDQVIDFARVEIGAEMDAHI